MIPKPFFDAITRNFTIMHGTGFRTVKPTKSGDREIGSFKLPPFQRGLVWTVEQKVRFIESIWLHLPIASYVVNVSDDHKASYPCDGWLLDGQQRWSAIIDYVGDKFRVFDLLYSELKEGQQLKFMNHPFPSIETRNLSADKCKDVYDRLVYGGTNH